MNDNYQQAFGQALTALGELMRTGTPEELFNNGKDATQGLTDEGERRYMELLHEVYPDLAKGIAHQVDSTPSGWSHPQRQYWTRPKEEK
ncbi:hypothetical protein [Nocardia sp. NPDC057440]|uniref:hypothetical protein n=1 Tax=Nocardia sp. NPDC057440 TaxID=3346134 RepID=UPI00366D408B